MTHKKALLLLVLTAALWSLGGILIKSVHLNALAVAGVRSAIAAVVIRLATKQFKFIWTRAQWGTAICFMFTVTGFVAATKMTTAANAILLQYTAPIYAALMSGPLLKEKVNRRDWITLLIICGGMTLFFLQEVSTEHMLGNILALLSGVTFAGIAVGLRMQGGVSTLESLFLGHMLTALVGLPFLFMGPWPTMNDQLILLALGIFQLGIPYVLYGIAIRHVSALDATLVPVLEPILNPIWVAIFLGETPGFLSIVGGAIVVGTVVIHGIGQMSRRKPT